MIKTGGLDLDSSVEIVWSSRWNRVKRKEKYPKGETNSVDPPFIISNIYGPSTSLTCFFKLASRDIEHSKIERRSKSIKAVTTTVNIRIKGKAGVHSK